MAEDKPALSKVEGKSEEKKEVKAVDNIVTSKHSIKISTPSQRGRWC